MAATDAWWDQVWKAVMWAAQSEWGTQKGALSNITLDPPIKATVYSKDVFSVTVTIRQISGLSSLNLSYPTSMGLQTCDSTSSLNLNLSVNADSINVVGELTWTVDIPFQGGGSLGQTIDFNATIVKPWISFQGAWVLKQITPEACFGDFCFYPLGQIQTGGSMTYQSIELGVEVLPNLQIPDTLGGILSDFLFLPEQLLFDLLASLVIDCGWAVADQIADFRTLIENKALQPALNAVFRAMDSGVNSLLTNVLLPIPNPYQLYRIKDGAPVPTSTYPLNQFGTCNTPSNKVITLRGTQKHLFLPNEKKFSWQRALVAGLLILMSIFLFKVYVLNKS